MSVIFAQNRRKVTSFSSQKQMNQDTISAQNRKNIAAFLPQKQSKTIPFSSQNRRNRGTILVQNRRNMVCLLRRAGTLSVENSNYLTRILSSLDKLLNAIADAFPNFNYISHSSNKQLAVHEWKIDVHRVYNLQYLPLDLWLAQQNIRTTTRAYVRSIVNTSSQRNEASTFGTTWAKKQHCM